MRRLGSFAYDFVVGDDPMVAVLVVVAIAGAWLLQRSGVNAWWGVPAVGSPLWRSRSGGPRDPAASRMRGSARAPSSNSPSTWLRETVNRSATVPTLSAP